MSKYEPLWAFVQSSGGNELTLPFARIAEVLGFPIDHSFLSFKKELLPCGWEVGKISLKNQTVSFRRL